MDSCLGVTAFESYLDSLTKDLFGMGREKAQLKFEKKLRTAVLFTNYFG